MNPIVAVEAQAIYQGYALAHQLRYNRHVIESNNQDVVLRYNSQLKIERFLLGHRIYFIQQKRRNSPQAQIAHISKKANSITHNLAKFKLSLSSLQTWLKDIPHHLKIYLEKDN